jgi:hypothetical protein
MIMKKYIAGTGSINLMSRWWYRLAFMAGMILTGILPATAQDTPADTAVQQADTTEAPVEEETTIKSKTSLTGDQYPDGTILLSGLLRAKIEGSYQKVPDRKVAFFVLNPAGEEVAIGDTITGANGVARIRVSKTTLVKGEDGSYSFIARFDGDDKFEGSESDLMLKPAMLVMEAREADSTYTLSLTATADSPDGPLPIAAAPVSVYVKRMFSSIKVAEGETDETGALEVEFPAGLAGDQNGNIEITAMIEETDEYGNLTATAVQKWGYSVSADIVESPRALWSPHPPTWMVITFFVLMGAVWTHYAIVIYNLIRIKSDNPRVTQKA